MSRQIVFVFEDGTMKKANQVTFDSDESSLMDSSDESIKENVQELPTLYAIDSNGKERMWQCWVKNNTVYRRHGLVYGKKIASRRIFKGKSVGKKNETTANEQAWAEANREWVKYVDKKYLPAEDDKEGQKMLAKIKDATSKTGGHNINAGAAVGAREKKSVVRQKNQTCMVDIIEGGSVIPMKAQTWELENESDPYSVQTKVAKYFSKVTGRGKTLKLESTEFYGQAKLDGWRARIMIQRSKSHVSGTSMVGWEAVITSNSGKQYPWFSSLRGAVVTWLTSNGINHADLLDGLDGELFALELHDEKGNFIPEEARFSTICSMCGLARSEPHKLEEQIQFHVFDLIDKSGKIPQTERFACLDRLFKKLPKFVANRIIRVPTEIIRDVKDVPKFHDRMSEMGYEGVVLRTFDNFYKPGKRSAEMRKFKNFIDEEYEIVGCKLDAGVDVEHFVWILKTENGDEFSAKPKGSREEKHVWYKNRKKYIGRWLTVKFQEYTEDGVPRFPIAKEFRKAKGVD